MTEELKGKLNAWQNENFPLLEDISARLYVYGCVMTSYQRFL